MAYAQWIAIKIKNSNASEALNIQNVSLKWGKFHEGGNKDEEVKIEEIKKISIPKGQSETIYACGREDAASGTEGSLDIYCGTTKVGHYYWECPWGSKTNHSNWNTTGDNFSVDTDLGNLYGGASGLVTIKVSYSVS